MIINGCTVESVNTDEKRHAINDLGYRLSLQFREQGIKDYYISDINMFAQFDISYRRAEITIGAFTPDYKEAKAMFCIQEVEEDEFLQYFIPIPYCYLDKKSFYLITCVGWTEDFGIENAKAFIERSIYTSLRCSFKDFPKAFVLLDGFDCVKNVFKELGFRHPRDAKKGDVSLALDGWKIKEFYDKQHEIEPYYENVLACLGWSDEQYIEEMKKIEQDLKEKEEGETKNEKRKFKGLFGKRRTEDIERD